MYPINERYNGFQVTLFVQMRQNMNDINVATETRSALRYNW